MESLWNDGDCARLVETYVARGVNADLAERTYASRLLGRVPRLVMHGGGNTSVKTVMRDATGQDVEVICIKGSGRDLGTIEPDGHPAVRMAPLFAMRRLDQLSDEAMVNVQRQNLIDTAAPNPSVETLLHAYIPHKFVDHTHSVISTAIAGLADSEAVCRAIYGDRVAYVPYVMPGFFLAKRGADVFDAHPRSQGLLLGKHGIFSYAGTARESYELMIEFVTLAEDYLARRPGAPRPCSSPLQAAPPIAGALPVVRGLLAEASDAAGSARWVLATRQSEAIAAFVDGERLESYATRGVATPEQVIRIKHRPAILPPLGADLAAWRIKAGAAIKAFVADYIAYFDRNNARVGGGLRRLDPLPRLLLVPGFGIIGVGKTAAEAAISCDVGEAWSEAVTAAEAMGGFEAITEAEHFDVEYWSLEQAKLTKVSEQRLNRQVVVVTGGGGAIGAATAKAFAREGAAVAVLDRDADSAAATTRSISGAARAFVCDVTDRASVAAAFTAVCAAFGGIDVVVSNAGAAWPGMMADMPDDELRRSFELNFFAHQAVAQAAIGVLRAQRFGGCLLFNVSKQAINPGPNFGSYGTAKAALLALVRQYALEHGKDGIRVNAVNADRIRSGLLTDAMIRDRAASRGLTVDSYMAGNLLEREVTADDVAAAFVMSASLASTTGNVVTVDGGNVAAMLR